MCTNRRRARASGAAVLAALIPIAASAAADPPDFDYILWDGHRFARSAEQHERDFRWYRDLGFTHTYLGNASEEPPGDERPAVMLRMARKYNLRAGLRYHFHRETEAFAAKAGFTREQMIENGMLLCRKGGGDHPAYNPMHPEVIRYYRDGFAATLGTYLEHDSGRMLTLFLLGTEMAWSFPKSADGAYPAALELVREAARQDGVLPVDGGNEWGALSGWWSRPHTSGGRWRLHKAIEDAFLERVPHADFMVDPTWAIKIVHGFGGDWSYIENDPKRIADAVLRLKAMTRPAPAAHSTQLIRGAVHDALLEANLLSLCMGCDKLYHWGINTFEPGRELSPGYGRKNVKPTPEGFPLFRVGQVQDWSDCIKALYQKRESPAVARIWQALDPKLRTRLEDATLLAIDLDMPADETLPAALAEGLNAVLDRETLFDARSLAQIKPPARARELLARRDRNALEPGNAAEMNRLLIEAALPLALPATPQPNLLELREDIRRKRAAKEPAIRSTGRLLRERGALFRDWTPMQPRLAVLGGIYGDAALYQGMIVGHIPFDILRNPKDRRAHLPLYRYAAVPGDTVSAGDYDMLLQLEARGGTIFVPPGFQPPAGRPALRRPAVWEPDALGKAKGGSGPEQREFLHACARALRPAFRDGGFLPYFDSENLDLVMQGYVYEDRPILFVVNDLRTCSNGGKLEDKGLPNPCEILIRDPAGTLRVIDIDSGRDVPVKRVEDGWLFSDTLEPAWYKLYAVQREGDNGRLPPPLPPGPEVEKLTVQRAPGGEGMLLRWALPFDDWVGCDVARYEVFRGEDGKQPALLEEIEGRILTGGGGVVTSYTDETAARGGRYVYRVRAITPLRRRGPLSDPAEAGR